jgi:hypothetical protein
MSGANAASVAALPAWSTLPQLDCGIAAVGSPAKTFPLGEYTSE